MTVLAVLLAVLGGFLDGLERQSNGAFRAQSERLWVLSCDSELQLARSRVDSAAVAAVADVPSVASAGGFSTFAAAR